MVCVGDLVLLQASSWPEAVTHLVLQPGPGFEAVVQAPRPGWVFPAMRKAVAPVMRSAVIRLRAIWPLPGSATNLVAKPAAVNADSCEARNAKEVPGLDSPMMMAVLD